jgi:hypothetical protein
MEHTGDLSFATGHLHRGYTFKVLSAKRHTDVVTRNNAYTINISFFALNNVTILIKELF